MRGVLSPEKGGGIMPHDEKLSTGAGWFADLVSLVFLVVLLLWGERLLPWVVNIFDR